MFTVTLHGFCIFGGICLRSESRRSKSNRCQAFGIDARGPQGRRNCFQARSQSPSRGQSVYSCSEKICRWNNVGWQGAWLGRVLPDSLMMTSIVVGGPLFCEDFVRNALFGRSAVQHADVVRPEFRHTDVSFVFSQDWATASRRVVEAFDARHLYCVVCVASWNRSIRAVDLELTWISTCHELLDSHL